MCRFLLVGDVEFCALCAVYICSQGMVEYGIDNSICKARNQMTLVLDVVYT